LLYRTSLIFVRVTVAAQCRILTCFQHCLLRTTVYHRAGTLDMVVITSFITLALGGLALFQLGQSRYKALGGAFQAQHFKGAYQDV
jgi:hypothetical protein